MPAPLFDIEFVTIEDCDKARGVVVVIDVCRAFTTAAQAFAVGAKKIILVGTVEEAEQLRADIPDSLVVGEVDGLPVKGFDFWNSPCQLQRASVAGCTLIQRTSAGTQGVIRAAGAECLLTASFATAAATVQFLRSYASDRKEPTPLAFVITGAKPQKDPDLGIEDRACAEYLAALLREENPSPATYLQWRKRYLQANHVADLPADLRAALYEDVELCMQVDTCAFAMRVDVTDGQRTLTPVAPTAPLSPPQ